MCRKFGNVRQYCSPCKKDEDGRGGGGIEGSQIKLKIFCCQMLKYRKFNWGFKVVHVHAPQSGYTESNSYFN